MSARVRFSRVCYLLLRVGLAFRVTQLRVYLYNDAYVYEGIVL